MMGFIKKYEKHILYCIVICLAFIYLYYFFIPTQKDIKTFTAQKVQYASEIEGINSEYQKMDHINDQIVNKQASIDDILNNMPNGVDEMDILLYLQNNIQSIGFIKLISVKDTQYEEQYCCMPVELSIHTNYAGFKKFISDLEESPFFNVVCRYNIRCLEGKYYRKQNDGGDIEVDALNDDIIADMLIEFYYRH